MEYIKAFLVGGTLCLIGQVLIDKTKLTPARILVMLSLELFLVQPAYTNRWLNLQVPERRYL